MSTSPLVPPPRADEDVGGNRAYDEKWFRIVRGENIVGMEEGGGQKTAPDGEVNPTLLGIDSSGSGVSNRRFLIRQFLSFGKHQSGLVLKSRSARRSCTGRCAEGEGDLTLARCRSGRFGALEKEAAGTKCRRLSTTLPRSPGLLRSAERGVVVQRDQRTWTESLPLPTGGRR